MFFCCSDESIKAERRSLLCDSRAFEAKPTESDSRLGFLTAVKRSIRQHILGWAVSSGSMLTPEELADRWVPRIEPHFERRRDPTLHATLALA